jgi:hypothetical protein
MRYNHRYLNIHLDGEQQTSTGKFISAADDTKKVDLRPILYNFFQHNSRNYQHISLAFGTGYATRGIDYAKKFYEIGH